MMYATLNRPGIVTFLKGKAVMSKITTSSQVWVTTLNIVKKVVMIMMTAIVQTQHVQLHAHTLHQVIWYGRNYRQKKTKFNHTIFWRTPALPSKHMAATKEAFCFFATETIIQEFVICTNLKGKHIYTANGKPWNGVIVEEFYIFCGLLIPAGFDRSWDVPARDLFSGELLNPIHRAAMSIFKFEEIRELLGLMM